MMWFAVGILCCVTAFNFFAVVTIYGRVEELRRKMGNRNVWDD